jgi:hypothetical protein
MAGELTLDVFSGDAFQLASLSQTMVDLQHVPTALGDMGLFSYQGVSTTSVQLEIDDKDAITLVPSKPYGAPATPVVAGKRRVKNFNVVHLPQQVTLQAAEVQGLRAFGKTSVEETAMNVLKKKLWIAKRKIDLTMEWQRMGAIKGIVYDADGTTELLNLWDEFGIAQQVLDMALDSDTTKVLGKILSAKRMAEDELDGVMNDGYVALCSDTFFDAFSQHPAVEESYRYQQGNMLRNDKRSGFEFGENVIWRNYRGKVGSTQFIEAGSAYLIPTGVPDMFTGDFGPMDHIEFVNTLGLPYYASQEKLPHGKGLDVQTQSNPLHLNKRPRAVIKLTLT